MWGWIVSKIIQPFLPYILGGLIAAGLVGSIGAYFKGRADMDAKWQARNMQATIDAQAIAIDRYRKAAQQAQEQAAQEARESEERMKLIEDRMREAQADSDQMEAQLASVITDKEKLNEVVKTLRAACLATGRDVTLDQRLRDGKQSERRRVPGAVVPNTRRPGGIDSGR